MSALAPAMALATPSRPHQVRTALSSSRPASTAMSTTATRTDVGIEGAGEVSSAGPGEVGTAPAWQITRPTRPTSAHIPRAQLNPRGTESGSGATDEDSV